MKILGIDPALNKTGWALIELGSDNIIKYHLSGVVDASKCPDMNDKLKLIYIAIKDIIKNNDPDEIAIEETFINKNPASSLKLGHARGAIIAGCINSNVPIFNYSANHIKKSVCGAGKADKVQMANMVKILLPRAQFKTYDESDAIAISICHAYHLQFSNNIEQLNNFKI